MFGRTAEYAIRARLLITSARGPLGGFQLAPSAREISVGAVVNLFFTPSASSRCLNGNRRCNPNRPCAAHQRWTMVLSAQRAPLDSTTIADLVDHRVAPLGRTRPVGSVSLAPHPIIPQERHHVC